MIYCEVIEPIKCHDKILYEIGIYCAKHNTQIPFVLAANSARIWEVARDGFVRYVAHPKGLCYPVDMDEFSWIKLQAKLIK